MKLYPNQSVHINMKYPCYKHLHFSVNQTN